MSQPDTNRHETYNIPFLHRGLKLIQANMLFKRKFTKQTL